MKELDIETWVRKKQYYFFREFDDPFFNITTNIEVTGLYNFCKENDLSFFLASLYFSNLAVNEVEAFRYRIRDEKIIIFDKLAAGSTVFKPDKTFAYCYFEMERDVQSFCRHSEKVILDCQNSDVLDSNRERKDLIYYSVIPWVSFTAIKHAQKDIQSDSIPRIVFGKYFRQGDRLMMPVSVDANHALMDGYHVGMYFEKFQGFLNKPA